MFYDLITNGYGVIPQTIGGDAPGKAVVGFKDWAYTSGDGADWDEKYYSANVALVTGVNGVAALDVDCTNESIANGIRAALRKAFPGILLRRCNEPKFTMVFQKGESLMSVKNGHSEVYMGNGGTQQIEYAGHNTLVTLYGEHRKPPHNNYRWGRQNPHPLNVKAHELPTLEKSDIEWAFKVFNHNAARLTNWEYKGQQRFTYHQATPVVSDDPMESLKLRPIYSDSEVDAWLANYDGDNYEQWNTAGRALHSQYQGSHKGLSKWDEWSKKFDKYEAGTCAEVWEHFTVNGGTTVASLEREVRSEAKKEEKDLLDAMLERYVLIEDGQLIGDLEASSAESLTKLTDWKISMRNKTVLTYKPDGSTVKKKAAETWLDHAGRQSVRGTCFQPVRDRVVENIGAGQHRKYWNKYVSPEHTELEHIDPRMVNLFKGHMEYIFDGEGDADWMLDWMAHMVQHPLERPTVTPLHINQNQRTGRGWVAELISDLVGRQNIGSTQIEKMADSTAKDNYMDNTLVVFIHEIAPMDRAKMWKMYDALKTKLTEKYQQLDIKYGSNTMQRVYARFFLMSNNPTCLPIQDDDERLYVMDSSAVTRPTEYYDMIYKALHTKEFMDNVFTYLLRRKIVMSRMTKCAHTPARQRIIERTRSGTAAAFHEAKRRLADLPFTKDMVSGFITTHMGMHGMGAMEMNDMELKHLYVEHCSSGVILEHGTMVAVHKFNGSDVSLTQESINVGLTKAEEALQWK